MNWFASYFWKSYQYASNWFAGAGAAPAGGDGQGGITLEILAALQFRSRIRDEEESAAIAAVLALSRGSGWKIKADD